MHERDYWAGRQMGKSYRQPVSDGELKDSPGIWWIVAACAVFTLIVVRFL